MTDEARGAGAGPSPDAEEAYAEYLRRREQGEPVDFEDFCARRKDLADALRILNSIHGSREESVGAGGAGASGGATIDLKDQIPVGHDAGSRPGPQRPPERIGHYKILGVLGEGGMGIVYLAEQREPIRRRVAVKVIKLGMDTREVVGRFEAERQALALMDHPNIARIHDAGSTEDGRPYFVMELFQGTPITEFCDRHKVSIRERLVLFLQVCRGVEHAHHRGVIHRDIKPSNVLVSAPDQEPVAKIIDFGVAKATNQRLTERTVYTELGRAVGTPAYMSPEQAGLTPEDVDHRTDVYSLGVLLYELLVGEPPLEPESLGKAGYEEILRRVRDEEPPTPSSRWTKLNVDRTTGLAACRRTSPGGVVGELRGDLDWITMKAIEKERERRYKTAVELADDVGRYLRGEPVLASPPSTLYRVRKFVRKNRGPVFGVASVLLALILGLVAVAVVTSVSSVKMGRLAQQERETAVAAGEAAERAEKAAQDAEEASGREKEAAAAERKTRKQLETTLVDMYTEAGLMADERGDPAQAVLWFANAARLAKADPERERASRVRVRIWRRGLTIPVCSLPHPGKQPVDMTFHPDGHYLLTRMATGVSKQDGCLEGAACTVWDLLLEEPIVAPREIATAMSAVWSPDGSRLVLGTEGGEALVFEFASRKLQRRIEHRGRIQSLAFSPDGNLLALGSDRVRVWDFRLDKFVTSDLVHPVPPMTLAFDPRGRLLATGTHFAEGGGKCRIFSLEDAGAKTPVLGPIPHVCWENLWKVPWPPGFVDVSQGLLTCEDLGSGVVLWSDLPTGKTIRKILSGDLYGMALSPDGQYFAVAAGHQAQTWHVATAKPVGRRIEEPTFVSAAAFVPDGRSVATGSLRSMARLWSIPSGEPLIAELVHRDEVRLVALSADGRFLGVAQDGGLVTVWARGLSDAKERRLPTGSESCFKLSPDGRFALATGGTSGVQRVSHTRVYDVCTGEPVSPPLRPGGFIFDADLSPKGGLAATVSSELPPYADRKQMMFRSGVAGRSLQVWEWEKGRRVFSRNDLPSEPRAVRFSLGGDTVAVFCAGGQILLFECSSGNLRVTCEPVISMGDGIAWPKDNGQIRFTPDGRHIVACGWAYPQVRAYDAVTGKLRQILGDEGNYADVGFWGDAKLLAAAGCFGRACRVWDLLTGEPRSEALRHPNWVLTTQFSRDGKHLVTGCRDGTARIWDWRSGRLSAPPMNHKSSVHGAAFTPDGRWLVTASEDSTARVWDVHTGKAVTPSLEEGGMGLSFELTTDGRLAVVGGSASCLAVFDLEDLLGEESRKNIEDGLGESPEMAVQEEQETPGLEVVYRINSGASSAYTDRMGTVWAADEFFSGGTVGSWADAAIAGTDDPTIYRSERWANHIDAKEGFRYSFPVAPGLYRVRFHFAEVFEGASYPHSYRSFNVQIEGNLVLADFNMIHRLGGWRVAGVRAFDVEVADGLLDIVFSGGRFGHTNPKISAIEVLRAPVGAARHGTLAVNPQVHRHVGLGAESVLPVNDLIILNEIFSVQRIDEKGGVVNLTQQEWLQRWQMFRSRHPNHFDFFWSPEYVARWHRIEAQACESEKNWAAAIFHLDRAIAAAPGRWLLHSNRARAHAVLGHWEEAARDYAKVLELKPDVWKAEPFFEPAEDEVKAFGTLAEMRRGAGKLKEAVLTLEECGRLHGARAEWTDRLATYRSELLPDLASCASIDAVIEGPRREVVIPEGARWLFFRGKADPSQALKWTALEFDDRSWEEGPSGFGFGDEDDATLLEDMEGSYSTVYVRRRFRVPERQPMARVVLKMRADDGFVAYLNEREVARVRAGAAGTPLSHTSVASGSAPEPLETEEFQVPAGELRAGENVLAIQGLNLSMTSSHFSLNPILVIERPEMSARSLLEEFRGLSEPGDHRLLYLEGRALESEGKHGEAAGKYREVLRSGGLQPEPCLRLVESLEAAGDRGGAEAALREGLSGPLREDEALLQRCLGLCVCSFRWEPGRILSTLPREGNGRRVEFSGRLEEIVRALEYLGQRGLDEPASLDFEEGEETPLLRIVAWEDGKFDLATVGPEGNARGVALAEGPGRYLYFRITHPYLEGSGEVWVRAVFHDEPTIREVPKRVTLEYTTGRSAGAKDLAETFHPHAAEVSLPGSGGWVSQTWYLRDAGFRGLMKGVADFRICFAGGVGRVGVDRVEVGRIDSERMGILDRVEKAFAEHPRPVRAIEALKGDPSLDEGARARAIEVARGHRVKSAPALKDESWSVVRKQGQTEEAYARALEQAEAACEMRPDVGMYRSTLGVAQYRAGKFEAALATLTHADELNRSATEKYPRATDLLFIALSWERLGDRARAREVFAEARRELGEKATGELEMLLQEAEREIGAGEKTPGTAPKSP